MQIRILLLVLTMLFLSPVVRAQGTQSDQQLLTDTAALEKLYVQALNPYSEAALPAAERLYSLYERYGDLQRSLFFAKILALYHGRNNPQKQQLWSGVASSILSKMPPEERGAFEETDSLYNPSLGMEAVVNTDGIAIGIDQETDIARLRRYKQVSIDNNDDEMQLKVAERIVILQRAASVRNTEEYVSDLSFLGRACAKFDKSSTMVVLDEALRLSLDNGNAGLQELMDTYIYACVKQKLTDRGLVVANKYAELIRDKYGENSIQMYDALDKKAVLNVMGENMTDAADSYIEAFNVQKEIVSRRFPLMTEEERYHYWEYFFGRDDGLLRFAINHRMYNPRGVVEHAYDQLLLSKGVLLNTTNGIRRTIGKRRELAAKWEALSTMRRAMLDGWDDGSLLQQQLDANRLERELLDSAGMDSLADNLRISYTDVQEAIGRDDLVVEFMTMEMGNRKEYLYAFVLDKQHKTPRIESLGSIDEIRFMMNAGMVSNDFLYLVLWRPFVANRRGIRNIYFSPTDLLNVVPVEYCVTDNGKLMSERYNMYRLSSTRQLAMAKSRTSNGRAVVYGGADFAASTEAMQQDAAKYPAVADELIAMRGESVVRDWKEDIRHLPDTGVEADNITGLLMYRYQTVTLKGIEA